MRLPNAAARYIPDDKITRYCLSDRTEKSRSRHKFFEQVCGCHAEDWRLLQTRLWEQGGAAGATLVREDEYGPTFRVVGPIDCPDGTQRIIKTFWIIRPDDPAPQLTSVVPI